MQLRRLIIIAWVLSVITVVHSSWGDPNSAQYHIQTDEGPERFFRFQTENGQFRKEKRLQDGTVIGTDAWIDSAGFLRQKDYIADLKGYRVLKSKTIFVGKSKSIEDAIKTTKSVSSSKDESKQFGMQQSDQYHSKPLSSLPNSEGPSTFAHYDPSKLNYLPPVEAAKVEPNSYLGFDHYSDELLPPYLPQQRSSRIYAIPVLRRSSSNKKNKSNSLLFLNKEHIALNSDDVASVDFEKKGKDYVSNPTIGPIMPSLAIEPPFAPNTARGSHVNKQMSILTPKPFTLSMMSTDLQNVKNYRYEPVKGTAQLYPEDEWDFVKGPLNYKNGHDSFQIDKNSLTDDYDGAYSTHDGFRYVLSNQYHEEAKVGEKRAGSFGYVDPFGIRRVVYYNSSPERGFVHRNNNRYVGLGATPYDPTFI